MNTIEDKWSMDESEILPIMDENISSFVEHRVLKATGIDDSGHDREDSYTSLSSSTSCTDAMADSQLELANARLMQANALADIARLKVAKAARQAVSASSGRSRSRLEGIKPITFDVEPNPRDRGSLNAVINDMQTDNLEITGEVRGGDSFERDLSMVMDADLPPYGPEVPPKVPNLLIPPPEGASSSNQKQVQSQFVPPLELNAEVLRNFAQKHE